MDEHPLARVDAGHCLGGANRLGPQAFGPCCSHDPVLRTGVTPCLTPRRAARPARPTARRPHLVRYAGDTGALLAAPVGHQVADPHLAGADGRGRYRPTSPADATKASNPPAARVLSTARTALEPR